MGDTKSIGVAFRDQDLNGGTSTGRTYTGAALTSSTVDSTPVGATTPSTGAFTGVTVGTSASPITKTATTNINSTYGSTSATDGDTRLHYNKLTFTAAGSGETMRNFTIVTAASSAPGGTINGEHVSCSVNGSGTISGAANALRATIGGTSTNPGGTLAAIQADSDFATGGTWTNAAFLRFTNSGTGAIAYLANLPTTGSGLMMAPHTTQVMTDSIRVVMADGNVRYIMCTTAATNRTGGA